MKKEETKKESVTVIGNGDGLDNLDSDLGETTVSPTTQNPAPLAVTKQLSIKLPIQVHRKLKALCALEDASAIQLVTRLVMEYIEGKKANL